MDNETLSAVIAEQPEGCTALFTPEKVEDVYRSMCALFKSSGMTITQLSRVTYVSERTLTRYFQGKTKNPHMYTMATIIVALGGDVNEILGFAPPKTVEAVNPYADLISAYQENTRILSDTVERMAKRTFMLSVVVAVLAFAVLGFLGIEIVDLCIPEWGRWSI